MAFSVAGKSEQDLMAMRQNLLAEIQRRGGKDKAPNYAERLQSVDVALKQARKAAAPAPAPTPAPAPKPAPAPASKPANNKAPAKEPAKEPAKNQGGGFSTAGKSEAELMEVRKNLLAEIERRGGKASAPNYAERLQEVDKSLKQMRKDAGVSGPPAENRAPLPPSNGTTPPSQNPGAPPSQNPGTPPPPPPAPVPTGGVQPTRPVPDVGFPKIDDAAEKAAGVLDSGSYLGKALLPEVFEGGKGLDRATFQAIAPDQVNFSEIDKYLAPSVAEAQSLKGDITTGYDELMGLRRAKLEGLNATENQALRDSLYRQIDRERQGAMRNIARTPGLGAGAMIAAKQATGRDFRNAALAADRDLLLKNIDVKRAALGDFENSLGARAGAIGSAQDRLSALRGLQATARQATDQYNTSNKLASDQFNSTGQFAVDQFNAGQQKDELAARVGAVSTGAGLVQDERDDAQAEAIRKKLMAFLKERDQSLFNQAEALFG